MLRFAMLVAVVLGAFGAGFSGEQAGARVDVIGKEVALTPAGSSDTWTVENITWGQEDVRKYSLIGKTAQLEGGEWQKTEFSFVPANDGKVKLQFGCYSEGQNKPAEDAVIVSYREVLVEGAVLHNANFDLKDKTRNAPGSWWLNAKTIYYPLDEQDAQMAVGVCDGGICEQWIEVKSGVKISVTVYVMLGKAALK